MTIGIYILGFKGTDKVYVGKSTKIKTRVNQHIINFKGNTAAKKLQAGYTEFGVPFILEIFECSTEELNDLENEAIEIFDAVDNGFNTLRHAEDTPIWDSAGDKNYGSKYSNEKIEEVFKLLVNTRLTHPKISDRTGVSIGVIKNVSCGIGHSWLQKLYREDYVVLMAKMGTRNNKTNNRHVKAPDGTIYKIMRSIRGFAIEHGLHQGNLCLVLKGKRPHHKGWTLYIPA